MKKHYIILIGLVMLLSCNNDEKAIDLVFDGAETGAILRTASISNLTFDTTFADRPIEFRLEYQDNTDSAEGTLLNTVDIFISFVDNTLENENNSKPSTLFKTLSVNDFFEGDNGLPVTDISITTDELLAFFDLMMSQINCTDKFVIDLQLNLTDGRTFMHSNSIGPIISFGGAINSPFTYDVIVVEGIDDTLFTGEYTYTSIEDGFDGPTIISPDIIEISTQRSNVRRFEIFRDEQQTPGGILVRAEVEFTIACDQAILTRYIRSAIICGFGVEGDIHVLLGPSNQLNGTVVINDDSVFDLSFLEAFEGNDGFCDWPLNESKIRFSKQ